MLNALFLVLIGAKIVTWTYILDPPEVGWADTKAGIYTRIDFLPTTSENHFFRIIQKSPYNMSINIDNMRMADTDGHFEKINIKNIEVIFENSNTESLFKYIDVIRTGDFLKWNPNILFNNEIMILKDELFIHFSKIPINEKINKKFKIYIELEIFYDTGEVKLYNRTLSFIQKIKYGRWFPTV